MTITTETPHCFLYHVFLNGENVDHLYVTEANEEAGYILCLEIKDKQLVVNNGEPVRYMLRGIVSIVKPEFTGVNQELTC